MSITQKSIKLLWAGAAGLCSFDGCRQKLSFREEGEFASYVVGEMAHICGDKPGSNRYNEDQSDAQRDDYSNLILLCPTHHTLIDKKENEALFSAELLLKMKREHEEAVLKKLETPKSLDAVCREIVPLLADSHYAWAQFGPHSDLAGNNPHSEEAHASWLSQRLSTIVPNNRRIADLVAEARNLFATDDQHILSAFLSHAQSYERWVRNETSYTAVVRFPAEFDTLIKRTADASTK